MHSHFHGACRYEWRRYLHAPDWGSKWGNCSQMIPIICVLNHERISWVSIEIYYHDNFVFGHIFMFLTSIFAHANAHVHPHFTLETLSDMGATHCPSQPMILRPILEILRAPSQMEYTIRHMVVFNSEAYANI